MCRCAAWAGVCRCAAWAPVRRLLVCRALLVCYLGLLTASGLGAGAGALEVLIAGNRAATSAAVDDGYWHHLIVVWSSAVTKDAQGQPQQGELLVYLDAHLVHRGAGQSTGIGAAEVSSEAGTLAVGGRKEGAGAGYGGCLQGCLACLAIFNRRLDAKAVARLLASPVLRGSEKGLVLYLDFDFEPAGDASTAACIGGGEVINRARHARPQAGVLRGGARLVLLRFVGWVRGPLLVCRRTRAVTAAGTSLFRRLSRVASRCLLPATRRPACVRARGREPAMV